MILKIKCLKRIVYIIYFLVCYTKLSHNICDNTYLGKQAEAEE